MTSQWRTPRLDPTESNPQGPLSCASSSGGLDQRILVLNCPKHSIRFGWKHSLSSLQSGVGAPRLNFHRYHDDMIPFPIPLFATGANPRVLVQVM
jgi:hypothetical protein